MRKLGPDNLSDLWSALFLAFNEMPQTFKSKVCIVDLLHSDVNHKDRRVRTFAESSNNWKVNSHSQVGFSSYGYMK